MHFSENIVQFEFAGTTMIGNLDNGYSIGLSNSGKTICQRLFRENVQAEELNILDRELFQHLLKGSFFSKETTGMQLESAYIHVTQRCNLSCIGCYSHADKRNESKEPSTEDIYRVISELADAGVNTLIVSGGEPFLRDDLHKILRYAKYAKKINSITVATNGCFINETTISRLQPYVDCVSVSFDGASDDSIPYIRKTQLFNRLVRAVEILKNLSIPVQITPTLHSKNHDEMGHYVQLAARLGATLNYSIFSCSPKTRNIRALIPSEEDLKKIGRMIFEQGMHSRVSASNLPASLNLTVKNGCGAGRQNVSIASDGSVYPCHMLHNESHVMGNIFSEDLGPIIKRYTNRFLTSNAICKSCTSCNFLWLCGGGCKARSIYSYGNLAAQDPYCAMFKSFYSSFSEFLKQNVTAHQGG